MASHVIIRMKHTTCGDEIKEEKHADHIRIMHGFDTRLQSEYLASLERPV